MSRFTIVLLIVFCGGTTALEECIGKCPLQTPINSSIIFLAHINCSKYCVCDHGRPIEMPCPANLHFSLEFNTCADPEQANCTDLTSTPITPQVTQDPENPPKMQSKKLYLNSRSGIRYNTYCANLLADCRDKPLTCLGDCPSNELPQIHLLAHEDCTKYCKCNDTVPWTKDCSEGLHFSLEDGMCLEPEEAQCDRVNGIISTPGPPNVSYKCASECPVYNNPDLIILVAHELCDKYCHCKNGIAEVKNCPLHLQFSLPHGTCVDPNQAQCFNNNDTVTPPTPEPSTPPTPKPTTPPTPEPTTPPTLEPTTPPTPKPTTPPTPEPTTPPTPKPTKPPTPPTPIPPEKPDNSGCIGTCPLNNNQAHTSQLPHINCTKFCKCDWGKPSVMLCPHTLHYNPIIEVCDYPKSAGCTGNQKDLPKIGFTRNYRKQNASTADCVKPCPLTNPQNKTVHVAHKDCTKFCKCSFGNAWVMDCPKDLYFNPKEQVCDFKFNVHCDESGPWVEEINGNDIDQSQTNNSILYKFKHLFGHYIVKNPE
ncbi:hypothetical protein KQX54_009511 [Cotesia glomerata]|uniref:Chitin-binding type-2 domain-containing protein n=1 Tax=Cotesia glomerata TaxID=32391 RepID=A0AAV7IDY1_COTGL|nr:hypothetical protein KQX54_009511 [Cotesia glomerata]